MGWCTAFSHRIQTDCDHAMVVADGSHCACPACGASCAGHFEACSDVWAAGPQPVVVADAAVAREPVPLREVPLTDPVAGRDQGPERLSESAGGEIAEGADLLKRIQTIEAVLDSLPDRIASGIANALTTQHQLLMADIRKAIAGE